MLTDKVNNHKMEENLFFATVSNNWNLHPLLENNKDNNTRITREMKKRWQREHLTQEATD